MIKDIAIQVTGSGEDDVRIAYAAQLAAMLDAHITALVEGTIPEPVVTFTTAAGAALAQQIAEEAQRETSKLAAATEQKLSATGIPHETRPVEAYGSAVADAIAQQVRTSDLFVGTRPYGDPTGMTHIEEAILFRSGRPCFFAPPKGTPPKSYSRVLVAWKETREAARAVADAMPLLSRANDVIVALVEEHASEQFREEAGADIGRYLSRHGIAADVRKVGGWDYAPAAIANEIERTQPDLVVMGGYGHSRFREWVLGGATREILSSAKVPVLMAH